MVKLLAVIASALWLAGCTGGAVVFVPTPLPPDVSPIPYEHPSGAFTIVIPRNWAIYDQQNGQIASVSFSPPGSDLPVVRVAVANLGETIPDERLGELMLQYQTQIRPDLASYTEQDRQALPDGSWRMKGVRNFEGRPQPLNTFLQKNGSLFSVLEVVVPANPALASDVQTFINTYVLNATAALPASPLTVLSGASLAGLEIQNVSTWSNAQGVFFITGEVVNRGRDTLVNVPIEAKLVAADGRVMTSAVDRLMGYGIVPGGYAPFSLRFGAGQPAEAATFELVLGGGDKGVVVGTPALAWEDEQQTGQQGQFYVVGQVSNVGDVTLQSLRAVVTVFDGSGSVIGAAFTELTDGPYAPGSAGQFNILVPDVGGEPAQYLVSVQGLPQESPEE
jgi:hypothetical protein